MKSENWMKNTNTANTEWQNPNNFYIYIFLSPPNAKLSCETHGLWVQIDITCTSNKSMVSVNSLTTTMHENKLTLLSSIKKHTDVRMWACNACHFHPRTISTYSEPLNLSTMHSEPVNLSTMHSEPLNLSTMCSEPVNLSIMHSDPLNLNTMHSKPLNLSTKHSEPLNLSSMHSNIYIYIV